MTGWTDKGIEVKNVKARDASADCKEFIADVIGAVEATSFERHSLWQEYTSTGTKWKDSGHGIGTVVGLIDDRPIFIALNTAVIDNDKVLFYEATSQLVDWVMIEEWLQKNLPDTARKKDGRVRKTDAQNFYNIFSLKGME